MRSTVNATTSTLCFDGASLLTQLIYLAAPAGASVITPLTTLLRATPSLTSASLAGLLGFDATVNLLTYDSLYQSLVMKDPRALGVLQAEQQVRTRGNHVFLDTMSAMFLVGLICPDRVL